MRKQVVKQTFKRSERNSEILAISNRYKDILDHFMHNSDPESLPGPINERFCNTFRSRRGSTSHPEEDCLNKNVLVSDRSLQLALKIEHSLLH